VGEGLQIKVLLRFSSEELAWSWSYPPGRNKTNLPFRVRFTVIVFLTWKELQKGYKGKRRLGMKTG
jgi:hypothetical protein